MHNQPSMVRGPALWKRQITAQHLLPLCLQHDAGNNWAMHELLDPCMHVYSFHDCQWVPLVGLPGSYRRSSTPSPRVFTTVYFGQSRPLQKAGALQAAAMLLMLLSRTDTRTRGTVLAHLAVCIICSEVKADAMRLLCASPMSASLCVVSMLPPDVLLHTITCCHLLSATATLNVALCLLCHSLSVKPRGQAC